jgi:hypothetical protein
MAQVQATRQTFTSARPRGKDQRTAVRFGLRAGVTFCWLDHHGTSRYGKGRTRDISTKGVYVLSSNWPPNGTSVAINIESCGSRKWGARAIGAVSQSKTIGLRLLQIRAGFRMPSEMDSHYKLINSLPMGSCDDAVLLGQLIVAKHAGSGRFSIYDPLFPDALHRRL